MLGGCEVKIGVMTWWRNTNYGGSRVPRDRGAKGGNCRGDRENVEKRTGGCK